MKLLSSFKKELILATRSFYFYIEIGFTLVILAVLLFAIPEHSVTKQSEYIYLDMPDAAVEYIRDEMLQEDMDGASEMVEVKAGDTVYEAELFETEESDVYRFQTADAMITMTEEDQNIGAVITLDDQNELQYTYYLQGYESDRLKNLLKIIHSLDTETLQARFDAQEVRTISSDYVPLNDRENTIPPLITFSGSLMGMFIMAAYIFLDKKEGVIRAFAVTASPVSRYLISKVLVLLVTTIVTGVIIVAPVMGLNINYGLLVLLLLSTGFFASVVGLLFASFYRDMAKAFGAVFILMILFMIPGFAYFIPSWDPVWVRILPTYPMQQAFKEILLKNGDVVYVLLASAGFLIAGAILFLITNIRFKKTLSV